MPAQQAVDAEQAKAADKAAEAKKIAARRAALKTIAPVEPEAVISDGLETEEFVDLAVKLIRANGWRCDSLSAMRPFLWGGSGMVVYCNSYRYGYEIADKGGVPVVTMK